MATGLAKFFDSLLGKPKRRTPAKKGAKKPAKAKKPAAKKVAKKK